MEVLLINPYPYYASGINKASIYPPIGLAYIAALLEKSNVECRIIDANILGLSSKKILDIISSENPKIIGISANIVTAKAALELGKEIKKEWKDILLVAGGPHPTTFPHKFLSVYDVVIRREGELTFLEIVKGKKLGRIKGISFLGRKKRIISTKPRPLIKNLDKLPFPAWHLLTPSLKNYKVQSRKTPVLPLFTSRGCPYDCIYCNKNIFGKVWRARSPENVIKEIDETIEKFKIKEIHIMDDNFTFNIPRAEKIFELIEKRKYDLPISCQVGVRADRLTSKLLYKMKKAGVYRIGIGIESGNQTILNLNKKMLDLKIVKKFFPQLKKLNFQVRAFFMFGLWKDTPFTMNETVKFALEIDPTTASFAITVPFPDTPIYFYIKKEGKFLEKLEDGISSGFFGNKVFYETKTTKKEDVLRFYKFAYRKFYLRPKKILELLTTIRSFNEIKWFINILKEVPLW